MDEDNPGSMSPAPLRRCVLGRTLGLEVRLREGRASVADHVEDRGVCGAAFSGSHRRAEQRLLCPERHSVTDDGAAHHMTLRRAWRIRREIAD